VIQNAKRKNTGQEVIDDKNVGFSERIGGSRGGGRRGAHCFTRGDGKKEEAVYPKNAEGEKIAFGDLRE